MAENKTKVNAPEQTAQGVAPVSETRTVEELAAESAEKDSIIAELQERLEAEAGKKVSSAVIVEHKRKKYEVVIPKFNFNGEDHTAETLADKPGVIAELIEIGAAVLKGIV